MGMFDEYEPWPPVRCPYCDKKLDRWQGKDGPCALFIWRQGLAAPVGQHGDPSLPDERIADYRLPAEFGFQLVAGCRFCPLYGVGRTENGVWISTTFILHSDAPFHEQVDLNSDHSFSPHSWTRN
jgi:hypothetical protein